MLIKSFYRKCPGCGGSFGRGKGANGLARHDCDRREHKLEAALKKIYTLLHRATGHFMGENEEWQDGMDRLVEARKLAHEAMKKEAMK